VPKHHMQICADACKAQSTISIQCALLIPDHTNTDRPGHTHARVLSPRSCTSKHESARAENHKAWAAGELQAHRAAF
jgi:hypothetical protein